MQFMEDLSDRELERYLADSTAAKWFCDLLLQRRHLIIVYSVKIRKKIGTHMLSKFLENSKTNYEHKVI